MLGGSDRSDEPDLRGEGRAFRRRDGRFPLKKEVSLSFQSPQSSLLRSGHPHEPGANQETIASGGVI